MSTKLTQERLKELLHYDPETGVFTARRRLNNNGPNRGDRVGTVTKRGYTLIGICGQQVRAHRLAWLYTYGRLPDRYLDHIDGNPSNNSITNLRECSQAENLQNMATPVHNTSGYLGVSHCGRTGRWMAQIHVTGRRIWLGRHDTPEKAYQAYLGAKSCLHPFNPTPRTENVTH